MKRICSKCGTKHDRAGRYCCDCHAAYMREWRKTHPLNEGHRRRDNARSKAGMAKKRGQIVQTPCCVCSAPNSEMHHPDHEQPLVVVWLCRECHLAWHSFWRFTSLQTWNTWLAERRKSVSRETNDGSELREAFALLPTSSPGNVIVPDDPDAEKLAEDVVIELRRAG